MRISKAKRDFLVITFLVASNIFPVFGTFFGPHCVRADQLSFIGGFVHMSKGLAIISATLPEPQTPFESSKHFWSWSRHCHANIP